MLKENIKKKKFSIQINQCHNFGNSKGRTYLNLEILTEIEPTFPYIDAKAWRLYMKQNIM